MSHREAAIEWIEANSRRAPKQAELVRMLAGDGVSTCSLALAAKAGKPLDTVRASAKERDCVTGRRFIRTPMGRAQLAPLTPNPAQKEALAAIMEP